MTEGKELTLKFFESWSCCFTKPIIIFPLKAYAIYDSKILGVALSVNTKTID